MKHPLPLTIIRPRFFLLLFFFSSCDEPKSSDIIPNPNATATFEECIGLSV